MQTRFSAPTLPTLLTLLTFFSALLGCATDKTAGPQERHVAARDLFERTAKLYHLPSAQAQGAERTTLLQQAAAGYEELLRRYPDQQGWCAQALRSLGNVRTEQGRLDDAVRLYDRVAERYPRQDWEVLQAWKSAADLLWDAGRRAEAKAFYQKVVDRFDTASAPAVVKAALRGSKVRLADDASKSLF